VPGHAEGFLGRVVTRRWSRNARGDLASGYASFRLRAKAEAEVCCCLAGEIAQRRASARSLRRWHASHDYRSALITLSYLAASDRELQKWLDLLVVRTGALIENHWHEVEGIVALLLEKKTASGPELRDAFRDALLQSLHQQVEAKLLCRPWRDSTRDL